MLTKSPLGDVPPSCRLRFQPATAMPDWATCPTHSDFCGVFDLLLDQSATYGWWALPHVSRVHLSNLLKINDGSGMLLCDLCSVTIMDAEGTFSNVMNSWTLTAQSSLSSAVGMPSESFSFYSATLSFSTFFFLSVPHRDPSPFPSHMCFPSMSSARIYGNLN